MRERKALPDPNALKSNAYPKTRKKHSKNFHSLTPPPPKKKRERKRKEKVLFRPLVVVG